VRIFYLDDDQDDLDFFADFASQNGFDVELFSSYSDLYNRIDQVKPDIMVLDLNMPMKSGLEVIKDLRDSKEHCDCCIAVLSTASSKMVIDKAREQGADVFLTKPLTMKGWKACLERLKEVHDMDCELPDNEFHFNER
jgi:DNA-binding response OmpR family regulator